MPTVKMKNKKSPVKREQAPTDSTNPTGATDIGSMEKIRDILFGQQIRESEKRFAKIEERLVFETSELRDELKKRFDSLEQYVKNEIKSIMDRNTADSEHRSDNERQLKENIRKVSSDLDHKLKLVDNRLEKNSKDLRDQILEQSKSLLDNLQKYHEQSSQMLTQTAQELRDNKVDRSDLSDWFSELSLRLSGDRTLKSIIDSQA
ncbi:MAG: hypothetical protein HKM93_07335 [Desulfobacteraceae bacterium]|nr:hypothetical protein [Desulfobacteraceae bacterium]